MAGWAALAWRFRRALVIGLLLLGVSAAVSAEDEPSVCENPNSIQACG